MSSAVARRISARPGATGSVWHTELGDLGGSAAHMHLGLQDLYRAGQPDWAGASSGAGEAALPGGERHGAVADDRGAATDDDLGDLAVLLAGGALQRAGAAHGHSLVDPEMPAAVPFR